MPNDSGKTANSSAVAVQPPTLSSGATRVLFVSTGEGARAAMAAAWLTHLGGHAFDAGYAGIDAAQVMDADILEVMREVGIEFSDAPPPAIAALGTGEYDLMIVLRPRDDATELALEHVSSVLSWSFGPLSNAEAVGREERLASARRMRDELRTRVGFLVNTRSLDV